LKTTNSLWPEYSLQISAYAKAYEELYGEHIEHAYLVRFEFSAQKQRKTAFNQNDKENETK
jgi:hypothetical protein